MAPVRDGSAADPCSNATSPAVCGRSARFCAEACAWNATVSACQAVDGYPMPSNSTLAKLGAPGTPLAANNLAVFFYGDSITWLDAYEPLIAAAIQRGEATRNLSVTVVNQGVNGGTVKDLVVGYSPWGHLDPSFPRTNITFNETLWGGSPNGRPDIAGVQIGINDVWQTGRGSNVTEFIRVLRDDILVPCLAAGVRPYLVSVSTIGEMRDGQNPHDAELDAFAGAQEALARRLGVPFVDLRRDYLAYDSAHNCLDLQHGLLTGDGVHPTDARGRGALMLANAHAGGLLQVLAQSPPIPSKPPPPPPPPPPTPPTPPGFRYGGRLFFTNGTYGLGMGGIAGADRICSAEAGVPARALLTDEDGCGGQPCRRASLTASGEGAARQGNGDGQIGWPLLPNRVYMRFDNSSALGWTRDNSLLHFPLYWYIADDWPAGHCFNQASGLDGAWVTVPNGTCNSWSSNDTHNLAIGWTCSTGPGMQAGGSRTFPCSANRFLCVTMDALA